MSSHEDSADEVSDAGFISSMKLLGFMSKAINLLIRNILLLAFSALTYLQSVHTEKAAGNIFV